MRAEIREPARMALVRAGQWRPTAEPLARGHRGYHLPAMLSPFVTLEALVEKFLSYTTDGVYKLREFCATSLAEGWQHPNERINPLYLQARAEDF